jgi:hypothetical protein
VVAFPSFKTLGEVHYRLNGFPLEIKLTEYNTALSLDLARPVQSDGKGQEGVKRTQFDVPLQDSGQPAWTDP